MRHALLTLAATCALLAPMTPSTPEAVAAPAASTAARTPMARVIVQYKTHARALSATTPDASAQRGPQRAATLAQRLGIALTDGHAIGDRAQVVFARGISSEALAARLSADVDVEFAEPDRRRFIRRVPNDPLYPGGQPAGTTPTVGQWYLRPPNATNVSAIDAETAWTTSTGTSSVVVGVLDTGVRFEHPDLVGKLHPGYDFVSDVPTANDGSGRDADASDPGDWVTQDEVSNDPEFADCEASSSSWHGTQVAGLIGAATHNGMGMASVARNVMVLPVRVLGKCGGFDSDIQAAMLWSAGLSANPVVNPFPARVLNLSLGSPGACTQGYQSAISQLTAANVTVVVSAGNDEGLAVNAPANCPGVVAVAGVRHTGTKVGFSSLGPEVALSAPGGNCVNETGPCLNPLLTTDNTGSTVPVSSTFSDSFRPSLGTSVSAPLVAGTAGLMLSVNSTLTSMQVRDTLRSTARPFPMSGAGASVPVCRAPNGTAQIECYCTATTCGAGMLDTRAAVLAVAPAQAPTAPFSVSNVNPTVGSSVTLEAPDATVAFGRTGVYQWSISSGGAFARFTSATDAPTATLLVTAPGTVVVTLAVIDDAGAMTSASTSIAVSNPPTAVITPASSSISVGATGTLDASASTASNGRGIVRYQWSIVSGGTFASLASATDASTVTLNATAVGTVVIGLTVTDGAGVTATTTASVAVVPADTGGGGALSAMWLLLLAGAVAAVAAVRGGFSRRPITDRPSQT